MNTVDVALPKDSTLPHAATQVRVFDRNRRTVLGSAVHDKDTVNYVEGGDIITGKPVINVVLGDPYIGLDAYIANAQLDGLHYPVLSIPE